VLSDVDVSPVSLWQIDHGRRQTGCNERDIDAREIAISDNEDGALKTPKVQHQQTKKRHRWIGGFLQSQAALKMTPNLYSKLKHNLYEVQN